MNWWLVIALCYVFHTLGFIEATVAERERYYRWMSNSWELLNRRLWWTTLQQQNPNEATLEDIANYTNNLARTIHDYNAVFGRDYFKEELLLPEKAFGTDEGGSHGVSQ